MTPRLLPASEWNRLSGTELEGVWPYMDAQRDAILVVEDHGDIAACWARIESPHLEGLTIRDAFRGNLAIGRALLRALPLLVSGDRPVFTSAVDDNVVRMIQKFGGSELPGRHFVLKVS